MPDTPITRGDTGWRGKLSRSKPRGLKRMAKAGPCVPSLLSLMSLHKGRETTDLPCE